MIVQSAAEGGEHFVITMDQHTALSAQFAAKFGNDQFEQIEPHALMLHVIGHHDAGWRELDAAALRDPATGLPYNLVETPMQHIVETSTASPDFNSQRHPYCALISSMHSWGLYNGRYGMSDKVLLDALADENRAMANAMLDGEVTRQQQLKEQLGSDAETAAWIEEAHLFQNYKQLQFFDTFALYFNCVHESARGQATYAHVPMSATSDKEVNIAPIGAGVYAVDPFPVDGDSIVVSFNGRYVAPVSEGDDLQSVLSEAPLATQTARLVASKEGH